MNYGILLLRRIFMNEISEIGGDVVESSPPPQPSSGISLKNAIIGGLVILVVGAAIGRFSLPAKVVTKTEIQTVTKTVVQTVVKTVVQKSVTDDKNKVTVITTTVKPDGSKVTTTTITDKSVISSESDKTAQSNTNAVTNTSQDIKSTTTTTYSKNNWQVS